MSDPRSHCIQVHRRALLEFFDTVPAESAGHATAICSMAGEELGIGLMKHYLEHVEGARVEVLDDRCTPGSRSGSRLDRWVDAEWPERRVLFQVEVKNWSAHAIGGRKLAFDASPEDLTRYKRQVWEDTWDAMASCPRRSTLSKVLKPMAPPRRKEGASVEPLVCMWAALHPNGEEAPWFSVPVDSWPQHPAQEPLNPGVPPDTTDSRRRAPTIAASARQQQLIASRTELGGVDGISGSGIQSVFCSPEPGIAG